MTTVDKSTRLYSTFDPRYIPSCSLWLDANDRTSNSMTLSGSFVNIWKDKSASGNNATAGVGAEPVLGSYSGRSGLIFGGSISPSYLSLTPNLLPNGTSDFTVFCTVSPLASSTSTLRMIFNWGTSSNPNAFRVYFNDSTGGLNQNYFTGSTTNTDNTNVTGVTVIFSGTSTTTQTLSYRNGNDFSTNTSTVSYNIGTTFARIGTNETSGIPFYGYIHEIIVYSRSLSSSERKQVEGYLGWKWGLESSLAVGHPYIASVKHGPVLSTFNPATALTGCVCWIDASDRRYFQLDGSNNVTTLSDKSGGTSSITKYGTVPWSATGLDGIRPAFNTNSGAFVASLTAALTNFTNSIFIVTKLESEPAAGSCCVGLSTTSTGSSVFYRGLDYISSRFRVIAFFGSTYFNTGTIGPVLGLPFTYSSSYNGSTALNNYLNGGSSADSAVAASPGSNSAHIMLGCDSFSFSGGNPVAYWQNGLISEVIVFNRVLTDRERFLVDSYLSYKWALQGNLPVGHAFKKYPPLNVT